MNETADYKKYVVRQMGLKEAQFAPFPKNDPIEPQISPTARPPTILALGIRGSYTGGLPSGADQLGKDISPTKVGGYDRVEPQNLNSKLVNKTPNNPEIKRDNVPVNDHPSTGDGVTHPHQIQVTAHEEPQATTGASTDSDPTLTLKSATPKGIEVDVADENQETEEEEKNNHNNDAMIPATSLSETFARHKKWMLEKVNGPEECATCGCGDPNDTHGVPANGMPQDNAGHGTSENVECQKCHESFNYGSVGEVAMGAVRCPTCHAVLNQEGTVLSEGKHKSGCQCGFCKNKGKGFGKKKEEVAENDDGGICSACQGSGEGDADGTKCYKCKGSGLAKQKSKPEPKEDDEREKVDEQQRLDESYAAPFQRMRSLAGVGNMILTSNGLFENHNDPGASKPFNTNWKMDKEKAGFVKVDEEKINKVKAMLERKSQRGSLSDKEMELVKRLNEVLKKRQTKS